MNATVIPAGSRTIDTEDMSIDLVCYLHALSALANRRAAGKLSGYIEATLEANPGLAHMGAIIPLATVITLPEFTIAATEKAANTRLWD